MARRSCDQSTMNDPVFVKHRVVDDGAPFGREHEVDPAVAGLKRARVAEVSFAFADIAARRPGAVLIVRKSRGQRSAAGHAVVEDQQQPAALELEEFDRRVGVWKRRILAFAPGAARRHATRPGRCSRSSWGRSLRRGGNTRSSDCRRARRRPAECSLWPTGSDRSWSRRRFAGSYRRKSDVLSAPTFSGSWPVSW